MTSYGQWVPDDLSPSGYRWQRHTEQPPTSMLPTLPPARPTPYPREQEDLSHLDQAAGELVNTEKIGPLDEVLIQPPQDADWRPEGSA